MRKHNSTSKKRPTPNDKRAQKWELTTQRVRELVWRVLKYDDDDAAQAFVALIKLIADQNDFIDRDAIANEAMDKAFCLTIEFSELSTAFIEKASSKNKKSRRR